ncbi:ferrochelatase [Limibacillus halophilus]
MTSSSGYDREQWPGGHPDLPSPRIGVLLINLGTPNGTDYKSMRRYLSEFLSDRRIVELTPWLWQPILQGIVLTSRPKKSGAAYAAIWNKERNESPLRTITRAQAEGLSARCAKLYPQVTVDWAMRYGQPSIGEKIEALQDAGCDRILLLPLYPHYSAATSATACDQAFRKLMEMRWQPYVRVAPAYYDEPGFIAALAASVKQSLATLDWEPEVVLASYHGLPKENLDKGDPYHCHCMKTSRLLRERLGWEGEKLVTTFQSRFGPKEWLQPYTEDSVRALAAKGVKRLAILSPGFSADCVETLEEIDMGVREAFLEEGGEAFHYIPCLNESQGHLDFLTGLIERELGGWL